MQEAIPANPYNDQSTVETVATLVDAQNRVVTGTSGWRYYVDNTATPPVKIFYCNDATTTRVSDGAGGFVDANDL